MKKQFLNLGRALNKAEQKEIFGGYEPKYCTSSIQCPVGLICEEDDLEGRWRCV